MSFYANSDHVAPESEAKADTLPTRGTALTGGEPPAPAPQAQQPAKHDDGIRVPDEVAKARAENPSLHDALGTYRGVLSPGTLSAALPPDLGEPVVAEVAQIFADHDLSPAEASEVLQVLKAPAPSDAEQAQWQRDTERFLATVTDADARAAVALLDRDPRVAELLETTGAINNPKVVRMLVDKARSLRAKGRL